MKHFKRVAVATTAAIFMAGAAFAQQSATNIATAGTILTDADKAMDVNEWSDSSFKNALAFGSVGFANTLSLGYASKTLLPVYFGTYYKGDLWAEGGSSNINVLIGTGDLGIGLGFESYGDYLAGESIDVMVPAVEVGYNAMGGKLKVNGGFEYGFASVKKDNPVVITTKLSAPIISAGAMYEVLSNKALTVSAGGEFSYSSSKISTTVGDTTTYVKNQIITVGPIAKVSYKLGDAFNYGMTAYIPFVFNDYTSDNGTSATTNHNHQIQFYVNNGFSADVVKDKFKVNAGVATVLPSINIDDDDDKNGNLSNKYYAGFSLILSDSVTIDSSAQIFDGQTTMSMDNIWKTGLTFTVSAKF